MGKVFELQSVERQNDELIDRTLSLFETMVQECPTPTDDELRRLLALIGTTQMKIATALVESLRGQKKIESRLRLATQILSQSATTIAAAGKVGGGALKSTGLGLEEESETESKSDPVSDSGGD